MSSSFPAIYQEDGTMKLSDEGGSLDFLHGGSFSSFIMNNNGNDDQIQLLDRPMKQPRTSCLPSDPFDNNNSQIISFGLTAGGLLAKPKHEAADSSVVVVTPDNILQSCCYNNNNNPSSATVSNGGIISSSSSRTPYKAQDHVLAERKRREKLSQRLIALSAVIPTLKKMDKATVLEDAVTYIKHLEQRIKTLEREAATKSMESVITVKKTTSQVVSADDDASSSYHHDTCNFDQKLLEIEARVSEKYVLIRVHCEKRKDCITTILNLIEKMNLTVLSNSIMQFGTSILDITIVAQIEAEFDMTIQELVKNIRQHLHSM